MPKPNRMKGKTFAERVVELARSIPPGRVATYGDVARAAGGTPMTARSVTGILGKAAEAGVTDIPWHRIVYANGQVWLREDQRTERLQLYKKEGIALDENDKIIHFEEIRF